MKTVALVCVFLSAIAPPSAAPAEKWKLRSDINLTLTQNAYSDNWAGGESGSMNWTLNSNSIAEKRIFPEVYNKNTLKLAYGLTYRQDRDTKKWGSGDKSTDLIDLESTFRWTLGTFVEPIAAFRGITQFLDRSDPAKDRWVNPLDLTESVGVAKVFVKDDTREWQTRLGVAAKQIVDRDAFDPLTGTRGTRTQHNGGIELVNDLIMPFAEAKILLTSKLTVFQAVISSISRDVEGTPQEDDWKYPDVNFENIFSAHITKYLAVNLYLQVLYDRQIDHGARLKQTLSLGLTYKLL